jgi:hypothetical protein
VLYDVPFLSTFRHNVLASCEVVPWIIDYFVNIALLDYNTNLAISSAQFG